MSDKLPLNFIVAGSLALLLGLWLGMGKDIKQPSPAQTPSISGVILPVPKNISDFSLLDHTGKAFNKQSLMGKWSLVFLGYTNCPDICPATLSIMKQTVSLMANKQQVSPDVIFVSVDPERDSLEKLGEYVAYFNPSFKGVTGEQDQLKKLALDLSVYYKKAAGASGEVEGDDYLMDHSAALMLINPDGFLQAFLTGPHDPVKIADSISKTQAYYEQQ